ncbi:hypothetical protein [Bradyrhizobium sp. OAE829]|uniref:hypothetical protein n=1 Tax=Bradyrhizobium sp. OAE829 TaxID=2663807 RepID=UPI00178A0366
MDRLSNVSQFWRCQHCSWRAVNTPAPNGIFLKCNTPQRVIELESALRYADFLAADEIFSTSNSQSYAGDPDRRSAGYAARASPISIRKARWRPLIRA